MSPYTIVLLYPDYLCGDTPYGQEIYVAHVEAENVLEALDASKAQAFFESGAVANEMDDFALCVLFEGHHDPKLFGWQL